MIGVKIDKIVKKVFIVVILCLFVVSRKGGYFFDWREEVVEQIYDIEEDVEWKLYDFVGFSAIIVLIRAAYLLEEGCIVF